MASWIDHRRIRPMVMGAILLTAGCQSDGTFSLFGNYLKHNLLPKQTETYSRQQVADIPYASIGMSIGSSRKLLVLLESVTDRDHRWLTADPIAIVTRGGRIRSTAGFDRDLGATRLMGDDPVDGQLQTVNENGQSVRLVDFVDDRVFDVRVACRYRRGDPTTITILGRDRSVHVVKERCRAPLVHWSFTNVFWIDQGDGRLWRSRQHIHPRMEPITIDVLRPSDIL